MKLAELYRRLRILFRRGRYDAELAEEIEFHRELRAGHLQQNGAPDPFSAARRRFGNATRLREESREMWGWRWADDFLHDLRYALRQLRQAPWFAAVVVLTLTLGIGANTSVFSAMNAILYRSLPGHDPDQLVYLRTNAGFGAVPRGISWNGPADSVFSYPVFEALRRETSLFSDVIGFVPVSFSKTPVRIGSSPEQADVDMVTGNFFSGLGVGVQCGRALTDEDERTRAGVAVLSYGYSQRRFGSGCDAVGQTLFIRGVSFIIVGVTLRGFEGVGRQAATDIWIPLQDRSELTRGGAGTERYQNPNHWWLMIIARRAPGLKEEQALAQARPLYQHVAYDALPQQTDGRKVVLSFETARGISGLRREYGDALWILQAMVGLVLLIACGNVAMLFTARHATRQREFGVRAALGGGRSRLFRQLLTESLLLVTAGAGLGWMLAVAASQALGAWFALHQNFTPDRTVLLFNLVLSTAAALVFGIVPFLRAQRESASSLRTAATTGSSSRERNLTRKAVVALQIALCVVLLSTAGLAVRTMINLENADLGLRAGGLLVFGLTMEQSNTPPGADERFFGDLLDRLRALPGVESVTASQIRLGTRTSNNTGVSIDRQAPPPGVEQPMRWNLVGPDYFATLGIPLRTGRDILASDTRAAPAVAVVNETFVKHYLPGRDPIGHLISFRGPSDSGSRIVAVAADSKYTGVREEAMPMAWFPYAQMTFSIDTMHFAVRTAAAPETIWPEINESVRRFAPNLPLIEPVTQTGQFAQTYASERLFGRLAILFGLVAVTLIATGVYGTLAFVVSRRTPEIGIRMALGARSGQVLRMVHGESLAVCAIGIFAGLPASLAVTRLFESRLYGVTPQDPLTFVAATGSILSVALVATLIPAQRAAKIDPATALRCQ